DLAVILAGHIGAADRAGGDVPEAAIRADRRELGPGDIAAIHARVAVGVGGDGHLGVAIVAPGAEGLPDPVGTAGSGLEVGSLPVIAMEALERVFRVEEDIEILDHVLADAERPAELLLAIVCIDDRRPDSWHRHRPPIIPRRAPPSMSGSAGPQGRMTSL